VSRKHFEPLSQAYDVDGSAGEATVKQRFAEDLLPTCPAFADTVIALGQAEHRAEAAAAPVIEVDTAEVRVKKRVMPRYPKIAQGPGVTSCKLRIFIDKQGVPFDTQFEECPEPLQEPTKTAVMQWRWHPATRGGEPMNAQFLMTIKFSVLR